MILDAFRTLLSRPARTFFTVAGIAIGILALTVVGSLAERLHTIGSRATAINSGTIFVTIARTTLLGAHARDDVRDAARRLARLEGVGLLVPEVVLPYRLDAGDGGRFGPPALIFGLPDAARARLGDAFKVAAGRNAEPRESRVAVVGSDFATSEPAHAGGLIALFGNSYRVIGVLEKSFSLYDASVIVSLPDAQALLGQSLPPSATSIPTDGITAFLIVPKPDTNVSTLVARINTIDAVHASDPREIASAVHSTLAIFDQIVFGAAAIALLVGAFSVINTMTIAVAERTREIGIRKALGAADSDVLIEFVVESAAIGALGGLFGILAGIALVAIVDARSAAGGNLELFALSGRVAASSFGFAVLLSIVAGFVPALSAARLAPTEALRR